MKLGYARISTPDQSPALQRDALERAGCEHVYVDVASGAKSERPELANCLSYLRKGDQLVVWKLDRLGRSLKDLMAFMAELEARDVDFSSLTEGINTTTPAGRLYFHILGAMAQMERDLIRERTRAGLEAARARGRKGGRPRKMSASKVRAAKALLAAGTPPREVAEHFSVSVPTLYRYCGAVPITLPENAPSHS